MNKLGDRGCSFCGNGKETLEFWVVKLQIRDEAYVFCTQAHFRKWLRKSFPAKKETSK